GTLWIWICLAALLLLGGAAAAYFFMKPADVIEKDEVCVYPAEVVDNVVVDENTKESIDDNAIVPEPDSVKSDDETSAPPIEIAEPAPVKEPVQPAEDTKIYTNVEPTYPGGVMALVNAVRNQVRPQGVVGDVNVEFVVEKDGSVSQVKTLSGLSPAADQEAIRVVSGLRMTPATHNGKPVRSKYSLPVQFR
ncbi:MAG: TonB family protein, partial [Prevotellaceae bacterium]|nr:TonB family protein [Prevotellaceae bacterium]